MVKFLAMQANMLEGLSIVLQNDSESDSHCHVRAAMDQCKHSRFLPDRCIWMLRSVSRSMKAMVAMNWMRPWLVITERGIDNVTSTFLSQFRGRMTVECLLLTALSGSWFKTVLSLWNETFPLVQLNVKVKSTRDLVMLEDKISGKRLDGLLLVCSSKNGWKPSLKALTVLTALRKETKCLDLELEMDDPGHRLWQFVWKSARVVSLRKLECCGMGQFTVAEASQIAKLTRLRELTLHGRMETDNSDSEEAFRVLFASLSALNALTSLDLSGHDFSEYFEDGGAAVLTELASAFTALTALTILDLSMNGDLCAVLPWLSICTAISVLTGLTTLRLGHSVMEDDCSTALGEALSSLVCLTDLHCFQGYFPLEGWRAVMGGLECATALKTLNGFTGMAELRAGGVQELELVDNELALAVAPLLPRSAATLTRLVLSSYLPDLFVLAFEGLTFLCEALKQLSLLTSLDLSGLLELDEDGALALAPALASMSALSTLNLRDCRIDAGGARALEPAFARLAVLATLDLEFNAADSDTVFALELAQALASLTALTSLGLSKCNIDACGASALALTLTRLTGMQTLDLSRNKIDAAAASALSPSLAGLIAMQSLKLSECAIGEAGAAALAPALTSLTSLTTLDLSSCAIGVAGVSALAPALAGLTALTALNLRRNGRLGDAGAAALAAALAGLRGLTSLDLSQNGICGGGAAALETLRAGLPRLA
jgi:Leucine-rich repeat (LRR) protein